MPDIYTCLLNMDTMVSEQVVHNSDDTYTIFLNARLTHERLLEAYDHAVNHIKRGDFEKEDANRIEAVAHRR